MQRQAVLNIGARQCRYNSVDAVNQSKKSFFYCVSLKTQIRRIRTRKECFKNSDITNAETIFNALRLFQVLKGVYTSFIGGFI